MIGYEVRASIQFLPLFYDARTVAIGTVSKANVAVEKKQADPTEHLLCATDSLGSGLGLSPSVITTLRGGSCHLHIRSLRLREVT